MKLIKIKEMSIPGAILLSGLIIGLSVFITTWFFFGGANNRTKIFLDNQQRNIPINYYPQPQRPNMGTSTVYAVPPTIVSTSSALKTITAPVVKPKR